MRVRKMRQLMQYPLASTENMDETALWLNMPGNTTVAHIGQCSIPICTAGHDKGRFTVTLAVMADEKN